MADSFYNTKEYKEKQSAITKENWKRGIFNFHYKREKRRCARKECGKVFKVISSDPQVYCSQSCSCKVNNAKRGPLSKKTRLKISRALQGRRFKGFKNPFKGVLKVPRVKVICANPKCKKVFLIERWMKRKFCSNQCAIDVIGGHSTSPKAARGKAGIRKDIDNNIYF
jgi:hypothetical protein